MTSRRQSNTACPRCKTGFTCGLLAQDDTCWCFYYPRMNPLHKLDLSTECACLCPNCLEARIMLGQDEEPVDENS